MEDFLHRRPLPRPPYRRMAHSVQHAPLILLIVVLIVGCIYAIILERSDSTSNSLSPLVGVVFSGVLATLSLIYGLGRSRIAAKDQYTFTLIGARLDRPDYQTNARILSDWRRQGRLTSSTTLAELRNLSPIDPNDAIAVGTYREKEQPPYFALINILNYWEHVCTAYVDDHINRQIFEDSVQDLIRELVARHATIIGDMRKEDPDNLEHLCAVWFTLALNSERSDHCRHLGAAPLRLSPIDIYNWQQCA